MPRRNLGIAGGDFGQESTEYYSASPIRRSAAPTMRGTADPPHRPTAAPPPLPVRVARFRVTIKGTGGFSTLSATVS